MAAQIASIPVHVHLSVGDGTPDEIASFDISLRAKSRADDAGVELIGFRREVKRGLRRLARSI